MDLLENATKDVHCHLDLPVHVVAWLDQRLADGTFRSRTALIKSLVEAIVNDDLAAHHESQVGHG